MVNVWGAGMNRDDIEHLTREAGCFDATPKFLERFAALVAAAEREAIAQMVENAPPLAAFANDNGGCVTCGFTPKLSARAIRARGSHA